MISRHTTPRVSTEARVRLVAGPTCEPISPADLNTTARMQVDIGDEEMLDRITTSRQLVEQYCGLYLVAQEYDMFLDDVPISFPVFRSFFASSAVFDDYSIELIKPPLLHVAGVYVTDDYGVETVVSPDTYFVSAATGSIGRLALQVGCVWPYHRAFEGFRIRLVSGFVYPFTVAGGVIQAPGHGLVNGQVIRVQRAEDDLPSPLLPSTNYTVTGVVPGLSLSFLDSTGAPVSLTDQGTQCFLGEIPRPIIRAIILTAALEIGSDDPARATGGNRWSPIIMPITATELLSGYRKLTI